MNSAFPAIERTMHCVGQPRMQSPQLFTAVLMSMAESGRMTKMKVGFFASVGLNWSPNDLTAAVPALSMSYTRFRKAQVI